MLVNSDLSVPDVVVGNILLPDICDVVGNILLPDICDLQCLMFPRLSFCTWMSQAHCDLSMPDESAQVPTG